MNIGRALITIGLLLVAAGGIAILGSKLGLGHLPGDIEVKGERYSLYFPLATCAALSIGISLVMWLVRRFWG